DLHKAGGLAPVLRELRHLLCLEAMTVTGQSLGEAIDAAQFWDGHDVVRSMADPIYPKGGSRVLRGNLAPTGAIIKQAAASEALMKHTGRAVVFHSLEDMASRIDNDELDVTENDVLVLANAGPKGAPGMPESG